MKKFEILVMLIGILMLNLASAITWDNIAYWDMSQNASGGLVDVATGRFNMSIIGTCGTTGKVGGIGLAGNGIDCYAAKASGNSGILLPYGQNNTISFWFKRNVNQSNNNYIFNLDVYITNGLGSSGAMFGLNTTNSVLGWGNFWAEPNTTVLTREDDITAEGTWHHYVQVRRTNVVYMYRDGILQSHFTGYPYDMSPRTGEIAFLRRAGTPVLNGSIDEVGIWNRSLNDTEIAQLYNAGSGLTYQRAAIDNSWWEGNIYSQYPLIDFNIYVNYFSLDTGRNATLFVYNSSGSKINQTTITYTSNPMTWNDFPISDFYSANYTWNVTVCGSSSITGITVCTQNLPDNNTINMPMWISNYYSYNLTSVETALESFRIGVNYNTSIFSGLNTYLNYNGTLYTGNPSSVNIPLVSQGENRSFKWQFNLINSTGTLYLNSSSYNQSINPIYFGICNSTLNTYYINFTYKDENDLTSLNASVNPATWRYWIGNGNIYETLLFTNVTDGENHAFCFYPQNLTLNYNVTYQYSASGYPQRRWTSTGTLTNSTTSQVLYLLSSSDGIYSIYQITNPAGSPVSGAQVQVERQFDGVWTLIEQGTTDSSGSVTFWLNPNYDHRISVTKSGYSGTTITIRPTSSTYTIILSGGSYTNATYTQNLAGIKWSFNPPIIILQPNTTYTFGLNVTADYGNLVGCKLELFNASGSSLSSTTGCGAYGGNISIDYNTGSNPKIRTYYYIDLGDGYFVLDPIDYWVSATNISSWYTIKSFFQSFSDLDADLGGDEARASFTKIVLFFLVVTLIIGSLLSVTGWDLTNPGFAGVLFLIIIWVASIGGWFRTGAFDTFENVALRGLGNFYIAIICTFIMAGFIMNMLRRNS